MPCFACHFPQGAGAIWFLVLMGLIGLVGQEALSASRSWGRQSPVKKGGTSQWCRAKDKDGVPEVLVLRLQGIKKGMIWTAVKASKLRNSAVRGKTQEAQEGNLRKVVATSQEYDGASPIGGEGRGCRLASVNIFFEDSSLFACKLRFEGSTVTEGSPYFLAASLATGPGLPLLQVLSLFTCPITLHTSLWGVTTLPGPVAWGSTRLVLPSRGEETHCLLAVCTFVSLKAVQEHKGEGNLAFEGGETGVCSTAWGGGRVCVLSLPQRQQWGADYRATSPPLDVGARNY